MSEPETAEWRELSRRAAFASHRLIGWGADDAALNVGYGVLEQRGLAAGGAVDERGIAYRQRLEDRLDDLSGVAWRHLGAARTERFLDLVEPVGDRFVERIDATAGPNWMPAARDRVVAAS